MVITSRQSGHFTLDLYNTETGESRVFESENLVTDLGLERMGTNAGYLRYCYIGSGTSEPQFSDENLEAQYASQANTNGNIPPTGSSPRINIGNNPDIEQPYAYIDIEYKFPQGAAQGNLSEIGVGWSGGLFCRTLIKDAEGNPTTITVLPIEELTVTYRARHHVPTDTWTQENVQITGNKTWVGDVICKAASALGHQIGWDGNYMYGSLVAHSELHRGRDPSSGTVFVSPNGLSETIQGRPLGATLANVSNDTATYLGGLVAERSFKLGTGVGNYPNGLRSISLQLGNTEFQFEFVPPIPKTNEDELTLSFRHSWGRYDGEVVD